LTLDTSPRDLVLLELLNALRGAKLPVHTGAWGAANLEVCEASISSSQERKEVTLKHQVAVSSNSVQR